MTAFPEPRFDHLLHLTDERGTFEHAKFTEVRLDHGYCTDDMARVLVVTSREPDPAPDVRRLEELSLRFLAEAQGRTGAYRNRMSRHGRWEDRPALEDSWGRSVWALGTAAARSDDDAVRASAIAQLERPLRRRAPSPRAMAYAVLGAAELLTVDPAHHAARDLITAAADRMPLSARDATWPWPERRLAYANAVLPESMIVAGAVLERPVLLQHGLDLLAWLLERESAPGHLSVTPVGGAGPGDVGPSFDQQPIEVAALADACARAAAEDGDRRWTDGIAAAVRWFQGENDIGQVMWDPETGGGFDGLHPDRVNLNQGAESTLAVLSTLQQGRCLVPVAP